MLQAALDLFGRHGFDATTTRMIAQAAAMNLGAIPYYFGSKEALYAQAAGYLADYMERQQRAPLRELLTQAAATSDTNALIDLVVRFILIQARLLLSDKVPASWVQFFLRAQTEHGEAFERLFQHAVDPVQTGLGAIVGRIIRSPVDDIRTRTLTFFAIHQFVCLRLADSVLMRRLDWDAITPVRVDQLLAIIGPCLRAQLTSAAQTTSTP